MTANLAAPADERKPPEIFWRSFIMRPSCSARLLVNGTVRSDRKRSTSFADAQAQQQVWPTRRGLRPRLPLSLGRRTQGRLRGMEREAFGEDRIVAPFEQRDQAR